MTSTPFLFQRTAIACAVAALVGCSSLSSSDSSIDYRSTASVKQRPLDVPPELTSVPRNDRYAIPERPGALATATQSAAAQAPAAAPSKVALGGPNARIERAGDQRWLAADVTPEQAFAVVHEFLQAMGLKIEREDAAVGIIETEWAENRAKLPQDVIRRTLGRVLDSLYSTGEQDKFRIRIERTAQDTAEIFISHRGMIEVYTTSAQEQTRWQPRPADPTLEAEMLQRLLMRFVQPKAQPDPLVSEKAKTVEPVVAQKLAQVIRVDQQSRVQISEPFDRAWRRVGLALDRGGFTVEDRDRAKGLYFVRYLDPDYEARQREKQGLFSKLFSREYKVEAQQFRVLVQAAGEGTQVSVQDHDGKPDNSDTATKIVKLLADQIK